jgi:hypothetical protein
MKRATFDETLAEAVRVEQEFRSLVDHSPKLSPQAFLREACANARLTPTRLAELQRALDARRADFPAIAGFLRQAAKWIREASCPRPPRDSRRLSWLGDVGQEAATFQTNTLELFAVAAAIAAEQHPEAFGDLEDWAAYEERVRVLHTRRQALYKQLGEAATMDDLLIGELGKDGQARITFKVSGGAVPIAPQSDAGERLVSFIVVTQPAIAHALANGGSRR